MKIIMSPAKQMKLCEEPIVKGTPILFPKQSQEILSQLQNKTYDELKSIFKASDKVTRPIYEQYQKMKDGWQPSLSPALFTYSGIAYQYMAPAVLEDQQLNWLQNHLYIISGVYGLVRPFDEIQIYRLEFHCKIPFSLYDYWQDLIYDKLKEEDWILNAASAEYSKVLKKYRSKLSVVDLKFYEPGEDGLKEKGVHAKMARGAIVRFCAENEIKKKEELKNFRDFGFRYNEDLSSDHLFVYVKEAAL